MDPALDAVARDELLETEPRGNHADGADEGVLVGPDLVGRRRQPVAARGRDILDEGEDRHPSSSDEPADARGDQRGLRRRAAGRVDHERHGLGRARRNALSISGARAASLRVGPRPAEIMPLSRSTETSGPVPDEGNVMPHAPRDRMQARGQQGDSRQLLIRQPVRKIHQIAARHAAMNTRIAPSDSASGTSACPEERPAEPRDQVDHRVEQRHRLPERRQHGDRVERPAEEHERRDDQQRHQLQLFEVARPDSDDEAQQREADAGQHKERQHPERMLDLEIDEEERGDEDDQADEQALVAAAPT